MRKSLLYGTNTIENRISQLVMGCKHKNNEDTSKCWINKYIVCKYGYNYENPDEIFELIIDHFKNK